MAARAPGPNALLFIFITILINMIGFGIIMPVMPELVMEVTGGDLAEAARWGGILSFSYALMQFFMMPVMGSLSDRFGRRPVIRSSFAANSIDFLIMGLAPTLTILFVARVFAGTFAASFTTANAYIADISPPEKRARELIEDALARSKSDTLSAQERNMLRRILRFGNLTVEDVMVPRADVIAVDDTITVAELMHVFREAEHSRVPVYHETLDDPRGMIHIRDLMSWITAEAEAGGAGLDLGAAIYNG